MQTPPTVTDLNKCVGAYLYADVFMLSLAFTSTPMNIRKKTLAGML